MFKKNNKVTINKGKIEKWRVHCSSSSLEYEKKGITEWLIKIWFKRWGVKPYNDWIILRKIIPLLSTCSDVFLLDSRGHCNDEQVAWARGKDGRGQVERHTAMREREANNSSSDKTCDVFSRVCSNAANSNIVRELFIFISPSNSMKKKNNFYKFVFCTIFPQLKKIV